MTREEYLRFLARLEGGSEAEKQHIRFRLSQPDAAEHMRAGDIPPAEYPGIVAMAADATASFVAFAASGFELSTPEETRRRIGICRQCEHFTAGQRCSLCGCHMRAKARIASAECPMNKW